VGTNPHKGQHASVPVSNDTRSVQNSEPLNLKFVFLLLDQTLKVGKSQLTKLNPKSLS